MDILESCYFRIIPSIHYYQNTTSAFERCRFKVHPNKKKKLLVTPSLEIMQTADK